MTGSMLGVDNAWISSTGISDNNKCLWGKGSPLSLRNMHFGVSSHD